MNKEAILLEDKVIIVEDEKLTTRAYYDGLEDVLVQENVVETIEKEIPKLEVEISLHQQHISYKKKLLKKLFVIGLIASPIIAMLIGGWHISIVKDAFSISLMNGAKTILRYAIGSLCFCGVYIGIPYFSGYLDIRNTSMKKRGLESKLSAARKKLLEEKKKLEELQLSKEKSISNNTCTDFNPIRIEIKDKEVLKQLRDYLSFYEYCGYYEDKFQKYYQNVQLGQKLKKDHTVEEIKEINHYLEEKRYQKSLKK